MRPLLLSLPIGALVFLVFAMPHHAHAQADLTAGAVTVQAGTRAFQTIELSVPISNVGSANSAGTFPVAFQVSSTNGYYLVRNVSSVESTYLPVLGAGSSATVTTSSNFNYVSTSLYFVRSGTYQVRVCANMNGQGTLITTESNYGNNCGAWVSVTILPPNLPDFTAGPLNYHYNFGNSYITATVQNWSEVASTQSFPVMFQMQDLYTGQITGVAATTTVPALGAGASHVVSAYIPYSLQTPYAISALANRTTSYTEVASQMRNDNDSNGHYFSPYPSLTCSVDNSSPSLNSWVTYTATANNASPGASITYNWNDGTNTSANGTYTTTRQTTRYMSAPGSYTMQVSAPRFGSATCPAVNVSASCPASSNKATLTVSKTRVAKGGTINLTYTGGGVDNSCTITSNGTILTTAYPTSCNVGPSTISNITINNQTVYRMTCDNGESTGQVIVNVIPGFSNF